MNDNFLTGSSSQDFHSKSSLTSVYSSNASPVEETTIWLLDNLISTLFLVSVEGWIMLTFRAIYPSRHVSEIESAYYAYKNLNANWSTEGMLGMRRILDAKVDYYCWNVSGISIYWSYAPFNIPNFEPNCQAIPAFFSLSKTFKMITFDQNIQ